MRRAFYRDGQIYHYIHRNVEHFNRDEALTQYKKYKEQNYALAKSEFSSDFLKTVSGGNAISAQLLETTMNEEEITKIINDSFKDTLHKQINSAIASYNFDKNITKANQSINNFIDTGDIQELDVLFKQIGEAAKLLKSNKNEIYLLLCGKNGFLKHGDLTKLNSDLQSVLAEWEGKTLNVSQTKLKQAAEKLENITRKLTLKNLNVKELKKNVNNIFSKDFGDYIVSKGMSKAVGLGLKELRQSLNSKKELNFEESAEINDITNQPSADNPSFNTSNKFKNFNIDVNGTDLKYKIDLGFNTVWYDGENKRSNIVVAQEKRFLETLASAFRHTIDFYYIYNTIGLMAQDQETYEAMKEVIIARNIVSLLSGNGNKDFSQYLVVNGKFYSVWDLINLIQNLNERESSLNPIVATIDGVGKISGMTEAVREDKPNLAKAYARARAQNQLISNIGISGHFYPSRLKNLVQR